MPQENNDSGLSDEDLEFALAALEGIATTVLVLDQHGNEDSSKDHDATVHITKNRFGATGKVNFKVDGTTGAWAEKE